MGFDYNTKRKVLQLPEYGRNVQSMVDHLLTIENRDERNRAARTLINVMGNLNPHLRDQADFKHKLWDHLMIMSNFELDIDSPYEIPKQEVLQQKPNRVPYVHTDIKSRHYGRIVEALLKETLKIENPDTRKIILKNIANHMKKLYLTWNREQVTDEVILSDLKQLAGAEIDLPPDTKLSESRDLVAPKPNKNWSKKPHMQKKKQR